MPYAKKPSPSSSPEVSPHSTLLQRTSFYHATHNPQPVQSLYTRAPPIATPSFLPPSYSFTRFISFSALVLNPLKYFLHSWLVQFPNNSCPVRRGGNVSHLNYVMQGGSKGSISNYSRSSTEFIPSFQLPILLSNLRFQAGELVLC